MTLNHNTFSLLRWHTLSQFTCMFSRKAVVFQVIVKVLFPILMWILAQAFDMYLCDRTPFCRCNIFSSGLHEWAGVPAFLIKWPVFLFNLYFRNYFIFLFLFLVNKQQSMRTIAKDCTWFQTSSLWDPCCSNMFYVTGFALWSEFLSLR